MDLMTRLGMVLVAIMIEPSLQTKIPVLHNYEMAEICELPCNSYTGRYWTVAKKCFPCQEGTRLVCMDNKKFCAPYEVCEAGKMEKVVYDRKTDTVVLVKDECPYTHYQPIPAECLESCSIPHSRIPDHVIILRQQTSTAPAVGYCDFFNGWISRHKGLTFFNLSQPFDCVPASEHTYLCKPGQKVFPNMSCTLPCSRGNFHLDEDGYFRCKFAGNHSSPGYIPEMDSTESSDNGQVSTKRTKEPDKNSKGEKDDFTWTILSAVIVILVALFICLAIIGIKACVQRLLCKPDTSGGDSPETDTLRSSTIKEDMPKTIYNYIFNDSEATFMNGENVTCTINNKGSDETAASNGNSPITSV